MCRLDWVILDAMLIGRPSLELVASLAKVMGLDLQGHIIHMGPFTD